MPGRWFGSAFRPARIVVAAVAGAAMIVGTLALAGVASGQVARVEPPGTSTIYTLTNDGAPVTIDKASWVFSLLYVSDPPDANSLSVTLYRSVTAGGTGEEVHTWNFAFSTKNSLSFNTKTDGATINTGSTYDPIATFDLTFAATSHAAGMCSSGSETIYTGTLEGKAELTTGFKGVPVVGGTSVTFNAPHSLDQIVADDGCVPVTGNPCRSTASFFSAQTGVTGAGIDGYPDGAKVDAVEVTQQTSLTSPTGASREDAAVLDSPTYGYDSKTHVFSVTASASGIVTGSATLSGGTFKSTPYKCVYEGKTYTGTDDSASSANYASPAGKSLVGHMTLIGNLTVPASTKTGLYNEITF